MQSSLSLLVGAVLALPLCAVAQERTASGNLQTEASWSALEAKISRTDGNVQMLRADVNAMKTCNAKGMMYAPGSKGSDTQGCKALASADPADLDITTHTNTICKQRGRHTVTTSCPGNERLLGCGGGPGDQFEDYEYWVMLPDFKHNRCIGYVGEPACYGATYSQTMVTAVCYRP